MKRLSGNIIFLGLVSFFTDLSSQMIFPLLPLYLSSVLAAPAVVIGIVEGAAESMAAFLKVVAGYLSDKLSQRKRLVGLGYGISAFAKPLFALTSSWIGVLLIRVIERVGKGVRTAPRDALLAESTAADKRGAAYGFHRTMDGAGSVLGAILAAILLPILGYQALFLLAVIPGLLALSFILPVKDKPQPLVSSKPQQKTRPGFRDLFLLPKAFYLVLFITALFATGHTGYAFLMLKGKASGLADKEVLELYVLFYVIYTLSSYPMGVLSDKWGRRSILLIGYGLFAVISGIVLFRSGTGALILSFAMYGLSFASIDSVQRAWVVDVAPAAQKGTALGLFHMAIGLVSLPGGIIAGMLWDGYGQEATFCFSLALSILAVVFLLLQTQISSAYSSESPTRSDKY